MEIVADGNSNSQAWSRTGKSCHNPVGYVWMTNLSILLKQERMHSEHIQLMTPKRKGPLVDGTIHYPLPQQVSSNAQLSGVADIP